MNYNEILFSLSSEWLCRAIAWDALGGVNKEENYLRTVTGKPFSWDPLSRGNFPGGNYLGVFISIQFFCGAIV